MLMATQGLSTLWNISKRQKVSWICNKQQRLRFISTWSTGDKYRFGVVVKELRDATSLDYKTALVAFINCIIISTPQLKDRLRIRNEFVGLRLLAILNDLKSEAASDTDLSVQIDVFEEQKESDESQLQGKLCNPFSFQRFSPFERCDENY